MNWSTVLKLFKQISLFPPILTIAFFLCLISSFQAWGDDSKNEPNGSYEQLIGPLVEYSLSADGKRELIAIRPFWTYKRGPNGVVQDWLWPLAVSRNLSYERSWRILFYYHSVGSAAKSDKNALLPFLFYGSDRYGRFNWGIFPFYGDLRDFFTYDEVFFIVFPFYLKTKRNQTVGESYFWPFVNSEESPKSKRFRVLPFYSENHRFGYFHNRAYFWPFVQFFQSLSKKNPGGGWMFWPLLGHIHSKRESNWHFIWPLFRITHRGDDGFGIYCPWPLFQYGKNFQSDTKWKLQFWPLGGYSETGNANFAFFIWPLLRYHKEKLTDREIRRLWALPLYWSKDVWDSDHRKIETYRRFWPLASFCFKPESSEIQIIDLWPQRNMPVVDRNIAPFWRLFHYKSNPKGSFTNLFWGLFSKRKLNSKSKCPENALDHGIDTTRETGSETLGNAILFEEQSYFFGLFKYREESKSKLSCRLFWLFWI